MLKPFFIFWNKIVRSSDWLGLYKPALEYWSNFDLQIERVDLGLGSCDPIAHRIQISYQCPEAGKRIYGYGESERELFAYEKAIAELLEREALFVAGQRLGIKTTSGLAAHRVTFLAKENAKLELQERDAFLRHWLTYTPLLKIADPRDEKVHKFRGVIESLGHQLTLARTYIGATSSVIAVIHNSKTGGFLIGSSAAHDLIASARKALSEALLSLHMRNEDPQVDWEHPDFDTHANHWFFDQCMPAWFLHTEKSKFPRLRNVKIRFNVIRTEPLTVVAATSPHLIDLWTGKTPSTVTSKLNYFKNLSINYEPHPFP